MKSLNMDQMTSFYEKYKKGRPLYFSTPSAAPDGLSFLAALSNLLGYFGLAEKVPKWAKDECKAAHAAFGRSSVIYVQPPNSSLRMILLLGEIERRGLLLNAWDLKTGSKQPLPDFGENIDEIRPQVAV